MPNGNYVVNYGSGGVTLVPLSPQIDAKKDKGVMGVIYTDRTTPVTPTSVFIAPTSGLYEVAIMSSVRFTGNRKVNTQTITHMELSSTRVRNVPVNTNTSNPNSTSYTRVILFCDAGTSIVYSNTLTGTTGSYNLYIVIERLY